MAENTENRDEPRGYEAHGSTAHEVIIESDGEEIDAAPLRIGGTSPGPAHPSFADVNAQRRTKK